jgi:phosphoglycerol geranylgeranyltransferase
MIQSALQTARARGQKQLSVLIDPDKTCRDHIIRLAELAAESRVSYFLWGGSLVSGGQAEYYLSLLRAHTQLPIVLFPGNAYQLYKQADAILFLSLISGRNPDFLIGQQVLAAPHLKRMRLEVIPTGYMLIDGGSHSSAAYMSNTQPIPSDKPEIASCTALAGAYLGLQTIYLDAGSGARRPVPAETIAAVHKEVDLPLIVGGGLRKPEDAEKAFTAGADLLVVGNGLEEDPSWLPELGAVVARCSSVEAVR